MRNKSFSVTNSVTLDDLEQIRTAGYDFVWEVAADGYEWQERERLYFNWETYASISERDSVAGNYLQKTRYRQDHIFAASYKRLPYPDPNHAQPPWLVIKGELEQSLSNAAIGIDSWKDWNFPATRQTRPLSAPALHRRFASLDTDNLEQEILGFAGKNGFLGRTITLSSFPPIEHRGLPVEHDKEGMLPGESLTVWREEIEKMGVLLAIWEFIRKEHVGKLGQIIIWDKNHVGIRFKWQHRRGQYEITKWDGREKSLDFGHVDAGIVNLRESPEFLNEYYRGSSVGPAWYWLAQIVNSHLHFIRPKLTGYHEPEITYVPRTLLDALWLLFMLEINGKFSYSRCKYCRSWFKLERSTQIYCSSNCRRLDFYHKKQRNKGKEA